MEIVLSFDSIAQALEEYLNSKILTFESTVETLQFITDSSGDPAIQVSISLPKKQ